MTGIAALLAATVPQLNVTVTVSPTLQNPSGVPGGRSFTATTASVTGGTPSSYNWRFPTTDGTYAWTVLSGQGTNSAVASVTGVISGDTASATLVCDVVVSGQLFTSNTETLSYTRL